MIRKISEWIDSQLALTGWFEKFYPLVEMVPVDADRRMPAFNKGGGQYEAINFDNFNGLAYLRLTSNPVAVPYDNPNKACSFDMTFTFPLRLVFCVKRNKMKLDDAFADHALVNDLIKILSIRDGKLKKNLTAIGATIVPESWTVDSLQLIGEEYDDKNFIDINHEFIYGAINFNASVTINRDCMPSACEEVCYA